MYEHQQRLKLLRQVQIHEVCHPVHSVVTDHEVVCQGMSDMPNPVEDVHVKHLQRQKLIPWLILFHTMRSQPAECEDDDKEDRCSI